MTPSHRRFRKTALALTLVALASSTSLVRLSAKVPRTTQEIDDFMRSRK